MENLATLPDADIPKFHKALKKLPTPHTREIELNKFSTDGDILPADKEDFKPGDIVRAEVSIVVIPIRGGFKMAIRPRRLLLLDSTFSDVRFPSDRRFPLVDIHDELC